MRTSVGRLSLAAVVTIAALLLAGSSARLLAECMMSFELTSVLSSDSLPAEWTQVEDPNETWIAVLRIEDESWMEDSTLTKAGFGAGWERRRYRAAPLAVLMGKMSPDPRSVTNGIMRKAGSEGIHHVGEIFEPEVGDTLIQISSPRQSGMPYLSLCSSIPVRLGYAMGVPMAAILARPGVATRDSLASGAATER